MQTQLSWVEQYLNYLNREKRYSVHTLKAVAADLYRCVPTEHQQQQILPKQASNDLVMSKPVADAYWQGVTANYLRTVLVRLRAQGLAPASLARCASSWRGFFKWAIHRGFLEVNPALSLKIPKRPRLLPKALTVDQAQALFVPLAEAKIQSNQSQIKIERNLRDQCLVELLYCTGLRISEAVGLDLAPSKEALSPGQLGGWLNLSDKKLTIFGKGGKNRLLDLNEAAWEALEQWLSLRAQWLSTISNCGTITTRLFINTKGRPMTVGMAQYAVASYAKKQNCPVPVHPHMLRHSFASHILQSSQDLRGVQELMGHASIASTQIYTALDFQHLAAVYDKAHPRAKK